MNNIQVKDYAYGYMESLEQVSQGGLRKSTQTPIKKNRINGGMDILEKMWS